MILNRLKIEELKNENKLEKLRIEYNRLFRKFKNAKYKYSYFEILEYDPLTKKYNSIFDSKNSDNKNLINIALKFLANKKNILKKYIITHNRVYSNKIISSSVPSNLNKLIYPDDDFYYKETYL